MLTVVINAYKMWINKKPAKAGFLFLMERIDIDVKSTSW